MRLLSPGNDTGSVAAEFAVALPAVVLLLAVCLGAIGLGASAVRLQDIAADAARGLGRGESMAVVTARAEGLMPGVSISHSSSGELVCVRLYAPARGVLALSGLRVEGASCALDGGR